MNHKQRRAAARERYDRRMTQRGYARHWGDQRFWRRYWRTKKHISNPGKYEPFFTGPGVIRCPAGTEHVWDF